MSKTKNAYFEDDKLNMAMSVLHQVASQFTGNLNDHKTIQDALTLVYQTIDSQANKISELQNPTEDKTKK